MRALTDAQWCRGYRHGTKVGASQRATPTGRRDNWAGGTSQDDSRAAKRRWPMHSRALWTKGTEPRAISASSGRWKVRLPTRNPLPWMRKAAQRAMLPSFAIWKRAQRPLSSVWEVRRISQHSTRALRIFTAASISTWGVLPDRNEIASQITLLGSSAHAESPTITATLVYLHFLMGDYDLAYKRLERLDVFRLASVIPNPRRTWYGFVWLLCRIGNRQAADSQTIASFRPWCGGLCRATMKVRGERQSG